MDLSRPCRLRVGHCNLCNLDMVVPYEKINRIRFRRANLTTRNYNFLIDLLRYRHLLIELEQQS